MNEIIGCKVLGLLLITGLDVNDMKRFLNCTTVSIDEYIQYYGYEISFSPEGENDMVEIKTRDLLEMIAAILENDLDDDKDTYDKILNLEKYLHRCYNKDETILYAREL